jgi:hypothetical protein
LQQFVTLKRGEQVIGACCLVKILQTAALRTIFIPYNIIDSAMFHDMLMLSTSQKITANADEEVVCSQQPQTIALACNTVTRSPFAQTL